MFGYTAQSVSGEGSRPPNEAYTQYYQQRQPQERYPSSVQQPPQQGPSSPYYQQQYGAYYYQMPMAPNPSDASASTTSERAYPSAGVYNGYNGGYAPQSSGAAAAPVSGTRPAAFTYPYSNDMMVSIMYPPATSQSQTQPQQGASQEQAQSQPGPEQQSAQPQTQSQYPPQSSVQVPSPRDMYSRNIAPSQPISQPQLAPMPSATNRARQQGTNATMQRATVSTHLSAIPPTMPITDPTGQLAPPGLRPRVTTTLWEDEGTTCFQVDARGFCVARREDNDMINGTKLLNVAGMTRGRRDGLLKGERNRHVVKAGAMHLKGVWIPYERALDFANKERIIDLLYPLFVTDIKSVLYHPTGNELRTHADSQNGAASAVNPSIQSIQGQSVQNAQAIQTPAGSHQVPVPVAQVNQPQPQPQNQNQSQTQSQGQNQNSTPNQGQPSPSHHNQVSSETQGQVQGQPQSQVQSQSQNQVQGQVPVPMQGQDAQGQQGHGGSQPQVLQSQVTQGQVHQPGPNPSQMVSYQQNISASGNDQHPPAPQTSGDSHSENLPQLETINTPYGLEVSTQSASPKRELDQQNDSSHGATNASYSYESQGPQDANGQQVSYYPDQRINYHS
ncbi:Sok2 protein [Starmerella bacillaris]|uniref:Sok2 protein n=1 Tax=Starmerella bacillaris TaxID=1247836 RepID=A0AAV5RC63_STABA|nr:Sok2 protein [Starmerella bacillaris]